MVAEHYHNMSEFLTQFLVGGVFAYIHGASNIREQLSGIRYLLHTDVTFQCTSNAFTYKYAVYQ